MTDPSDAHSGHPSDDLDELVSAYLDGEATQEEVARVDADPQLLGRVAELRALAAAVARPVDLPPAEARDAAIAAAVAAATTTPAASSEPDTPVDLEAERARRHQHRRRLWAVSVAAAAVAAIAAVPLLARFGTDGGDGDTAAVTADQEQLQDSTADEGGGRAEATTEAGEDSGDGGTLSENPEDAGGFVVVALGSFLDQDRLLQAVRQEQATVAPSQGPASTLLPAAAAATTLCPSPLAPTEEITGVYQAAVADAPVTVYVYRKGAAGQAVIVLDATCDPLLQTDL